MKKVNLSFKKGDEDGLLNDCIKTVASFLDNTSSIPIRVSLDDSAECPTVTIFNNKKQCLSCSFDWYRKFGDFKANSCRFVFRTGTADEIVFEFVWSNSGSESWVQEYQEVQRLIKKLEEIIINSGLVRRLPSSYLKN